MEKKRVDVRIGEVTREADKEGVKILDVEEIMANKGILLSQMEPRTSAFIRVSSYFSADG